VSGAAVVVAGATAVVVSGTVVVVSATVVVVGTSVCTAVVVCSVTDTHLYYIIIYAFWLLRNIKELSMFFSQRIDKSYFVTLYAV